MFLNKLISFAAILEIYKKMIINPPIYKINIINEIQDVLLIKFIIKVNVIDWNIIIRLDIKGDFIFVNKIEIIRLIEIIKLLYIIQCIF